MLWQSPESLELDVDLEVITGRGADLTSGGGRVAGSGRNVAVHRRTPAVGGRGPGSQRGAVGLVPERFRPRPRRVDAGPPAVRGASGTSTRMRSPIRTRLYCPFCWACGMLSLKERAIGSGGAHAPAAQRGTLARIGAQPMQLQGLRLHNRIEGWLGRFQLRPAWHAG